MSEHNKTPGSRRIGLNFGTERKTLDVRVAVKLLLVRWTWFPLMAAPGRCWSTPAPGEHEPHLLGFSMRASGE